MRRQPDFRANLLRIAEWQTGWRTGADPTSRLYAADRTTVPVLPDSMPYDGDVARKKLSAAARAGQVVRVRRGVYVQLPAGSGSRSDDRESAVLRGVRGLIDVSTSDICFSHATAGLLHRCWLYRTSELVHVTYPSKPQVPRAADPEVRRHWMRLGATDRTTVDRIPVTTLERTVYDCASTMTFDGAAVLVTSAFRRGADPLRVAEILDDRAGARGINAARAVCAVVDPGCASPGEVLMYLAARRARADGLATQLPVATRLGRFWVDAGWAARKVGLEFHGAVKYSGGAFGDPTTRKEARAVRSQALGEEGWRILDLEWGDVIDQQRVELMIREALLRRRLQ